LPSGRLVVSSRAVELAGSPTPFLSKWDTALLETLARRPRRVFTRSERMAGVFADADDHRVVDTHVHYLRRKLLGSWYRPGPYTCSHRAHRFTTAAG
jgi:two-component system response regulator QseB